MRVSVLTERMRNALEPDTGNTNRQNFAKLYSYSTFVIYCMAFTTDKCLTLNQSVTLIKLVSYISVAKLTQFLSVLMFLCIFYESEQHSLLDYVHEGCQPSNNQFLHNTLLP